MHLYRLTFGRYPPCKYPIPWHFWVYLLFNFTAAYCSLPSVFHIGASFGTYFGTPVFRTPVFGTPVFIVPEATRALLPPSCPDPSVKRDGTDVQKPDCE